MSCDNQASINSLFNNLTNDYTSNFPNIDWNDDAFKIPPELLEAIQKETPKVGISELTVKRFDGTGNFDVIMASISSHIREEFRANRITGSDYARVWLSSLETGLTQAVQFTLSKDEAAWKAIAAQLQAITAMANLKLIQAQIAAMKQDEALKKAQYGLTKAQILSQEIQQCLLNEQIETERANTLDVRSDGVTPISGSVGKQKDLYSQQITSYQRKSEMDVAKVWFDAWATHYTITESDTIPNSFTNPSVDTMMNTLKTKAGM